jgi:hypothetical protein
LGYLENGTAKGPRTDANELRRLIKKLFPSQAKPGVMKPGWRLSAFQSAKSSKSYKMIVFVL